MGVPRRAASLALEDRRAKAGRHGWGPEGRAARLLATAGYEGRRLLVLVFVFLFEVLGVFGLVEQVGQALVLLEAIVLVLVGVPAASQRIDHRLASLARWRCVAWRNLVRLSSARSAALLPFAALA
jgi:hypothetical protein